MAFLLRSHQEGEVTLVHLWISYTHLTYGPLLYGKLAPVCRKCGAHLTVANILVDCPPYAEARHIYHPDGMIIRVWSVLFWQLYLQ